MWGIFDTTYKNDVDELFSVAAKVSSMIDILNWRFDKKGYDQIDVGIGLDYGRALMLKAGYKGSGINDVIWMGDVVNGASVLCSYGNKRYNDKEIMVSSTFQDNLNDHNKDLLSWNSDRSCYNGYVVNTAMNNWLKEQQ